MRRSLALAVLVGSVACGGGPVPAPPNPSSDGAAPPAAAAQPVAAPVPQAPVDPETAWAGRTERASVGRAIEGFKRASERAPNDPAPLVALTRAYVFLADAHLRTTAERGQRSDALEQAMDAGERALLLASPEFAAAAKAGQPIDKAVETCEVAAAPALAAYGSALSRYAIDKGFTALLMYKDRIIAVMRRVIALAPETQYATADRELGSFYARTPAFAGGDLAKSRAHFEKAMERAPAALDTRLRFAETYAVEVHDRDLFSKLLQEVHDADLGPPDLAPDNQLVKKRADLLAQSINDLFAP